MPKVEPSRLAFADAIRALAALWVVLFHLSEGGHLAHLKSVMPSSITAVVFDWGHLGVAAFFCLSGYVMMLTVGRGHMTFPGFGQFMAKRLVRLTPPYYLAIATAMALLLVKARLAGQVVEYPTLSSLAAHLVYAQELLGFPEINSVFWTLCIELQFYLAFGLMLWLMTLLARWARIDGLHLWGLVAMAWGSLAFPLEWVEVPQLVGSFLPFWYAFLAGVMACLSWKNTGWVRGLGILYLIAVLVASKLFNSGFMATVATTGLLLALTSMTGRMTLLQNCRPLMFIATISYSLYLLHNPVTGAVANVLRRFTGVGVQADVCVLVATVGGSMAAAWVAYAWVEKPSMRLSRKFS